MFLFLLTGRVGLRGFGTGHLFDLAWRVCRVSGFGFKNQYMRAATHTDQQHNNQRLKQERFHTRVNGQNGILPEHLTSKQAASRLFWLKHQQASACSDWANLEIRVIRSSTCPSEHVEQLGS
jgi:hypothetical protein